jgi:sugar phosphate isomerase/epimerase
MERKIIVVTAAYGRDRIQALGGQSAVLPIIAEAGADGVEIRRELLTSTQPDHLTSLADAIAANGLMACYSAPETLCLLDGSLNPQIPELLLEAHRLNARWLKLSLGHFQENFPANRLRQWLAESPVALVVENDQTPGGRLAPMARFRDACRQHQLPVSLTFDMGNWLWVDESPEQAARQLAPAVGYVHVKAAAPGNHGWRALPPDEAGERWAALLNLLPTDVPRGIEFPLEGRDLTAVTRHYVNLLREE